MMSYTGPVSPEVGALSLIVNLMEDSIYMGRNVLESLGSPRQVQMMLNEEQKKLLLQACGVQDREAVVVPPQPTLFFQMSGKSLLRKIRKLTNWDDDQMRILYGQKIPGHAAVVFDLNTAKTTDWGDLYYVAGTDDPEYPLS